MEFEIMLKSRQTGAGISYMIGPESMDAALKTINRQFDRQAEECRRKGFTYHRPEIIWIRPC